MKLSFGKKIMLAATMAVLVSGGAAICNTVQTEAASSKASGFSYESGAMRFSQPVPMGHLTGCKGGPAPFHMWPRENSRISGRNVIVGSGPQALVYHTKDIYPNSPAITSVSTVSGIELAKFKPFEVRNARVHRIDTNKNLTLYVEIYTAPDIGSTANFAIRGVTKEGKAYTYVDGLKLLKQHYNISRGQTADFGYPYPNNVKVQGNTIYIPFTLGYREGYDPNKIKGTLVFDWNESANWFSYRIQ